MNPVLGECTGLQRLQPKLIFFLLEMPTQVQHPLCELVGVTTDVSRLGRGKVGLHPFHVHLGDGANVGVAHDSLAKVICAVFCLFGASA